MSVPNVKVESQDVNDVIFARGHLPLLAHDSIANLDVRFLESGM